MSPNLVKLSFSLPVLWAKNLKGGAEHPRGRIALCTNKLKHCFVVKNGDTCCTYPSVSNALFLQFLFQAINKVHAP